MPTWLCYIVLRYISDTFHKHISHKISNTISMTAIYSSTGKVGNSNEFTYNKAY